MPSRGLAFAVGIAGVVFARTALADAPPLGPDGTRIGTNAFRIDLFQGPVLASSRATGLAGAYAPIAEGAEGHAVNAASPAVRELWSRKWFDWDLSAGVTFPNALAHTDFDNNGSTGFRYSSFLFGTLGANVQLGSWGFGASLHGQTYQLGNQEGGASLEVQIARIDALLARSFFDGQLVIGAGVRATSLELDTRQGTDLRVLFRTQSAGLQAGALIAPTRWPIRIGATVRGAMRPDAAEHGDDVQIDANGQAYVESGDRWYLPTEVVLPWEVEIGAAWQLGPRPLNVPWVNPKHPPPELLEEKRNEAGEVVRVRDPDAIDRKLRARYRALPREKLLVVAALLVSGPVEDAVGVESFLGQYVERSGLRPTYTPRLGIEGEPLANVLQLRAGSYLEPSRFANGTARVHGTFGFDLRVLSWDVFGLLDDDTSWRVGGFADVARAYVGWGVSLGLWH